MNDTESKLWSLFQFQSKFTMHPLADCYQQDFLIRAILGGFNKSDIIHYFGEFYRYTLQSAENAYERAEATLSANQPLPNS